MAVIPVTKFGRLPRDLPLISGHSGPILDYEFSPFDDHMLATCSEDLMVKIWQIPEGGFTAHQKEAAVTLEGHGKKVSFCTWNPCASHVIASTAFEPSIKIWNVAEQDCCFHIDMPEGVQAWHMKWSYLGSLLAITGKDKKMRVVDPRTQKFVLEAQVHGGSKAIKIDWMGSPERADDCNKILSTGFSTDASRQIGVWDLRKFGTAEEEAEPLNMLTLDQGTGALYPTYDAGTNMAFFAGKGDANVRYFEMDAAEPYTHFISQYGSTTASKGFDFLPKRAVDTTCHEVMRGIQLQNDKILPISFKVPRKSEAFQEDIFPDAPSGEPAMSSKEWMEGKACTAPICRSMRPGADGGAGARKSTTGSSLGIVSVKELKKQLEEAQERIKALEAENASLKEQLAAK
jgi:coronin-1B/1C/6